MELLIARSVNYGVMFRTELRSFPENPVKKILGF